MRKKHVMIVLLASLALLLALTSMSYANSYSFKGKCSYNGSKIVSDFTSDDIAAAQSKLQPGDVLTYEITYTNNSKDTTEWYMRNKVLETLEEKKDAAENGGYTYVLKNQGPDGTTTLFSNDKVGGERSSKKIMEGLLQATNATGKFFFIQELDPGESAKTKLKVKFDGETEVNDYMDTEGSLLVQYAVEKKPVKEKEKRKTIVQKVKTGDESQIYLFIALMAAAVLAALIAIYFWRRDRRNDDEKGGDLA